MKEWFKARNIWGAAILSMPDEEAGKLAKAIWSYTMNGYADEIEGQVGGIFAMIQMTLKQDEEKEAEISEKRAVAGAIGGFHKQANSGKVKQMIANDSKCKQTVANVANATNKNKNKNKNKESEKESESEDYDADALRIVKEHNRILDAAEDAGFQKTNSVRAKLIDLYAEHGMDKVLAGIESCVKHGVPTLAYLEACMKDQPKKKNDEKNYDNQRSYTGKDSEAMNRMLAQMEAMDA